MSLSLFELQAQFSSALNYQAKGQDCDITSDLFDADERIQIYRNNFILSLSEVLQASYPIVEALVGEECFEQLARQHVLLNPLLKGDVTDYGEGFESTILQFPAVMEAAPYLPEVAKFEWHLDCSYQRYCRATFPDITLMTQISQVAESQHGDLVLYLSPSVIAVESPVAVFSLQQAIKNNNFESLELNQSECGYVSCETNGETSVQQLSQDECALLVCLGTQKTLSEIPEALLPHLNTLIEKQLIAGFTVKNH